MSEPQPPKAARRPVGRPRKKVKPKPAPPPEVKATFDELLLDVRVLLEELVTLQFVSTIRGVGVQLNRREETRMKEFRAYLQKRLTTTHKGFKC